MRKFLAIRGTNMRGLTCPVVLLFMATGCAKSTPSTPVASQPDVARPKTETISSDNDRKLAPAGSEIPNDLGYRIMDEQTIPGIKRSLDIQLDKRVSVEVLRALATRLKQSDPKRYERTFISYYLPGMKVGSGAWATSHFDPDLQVRILGITSDQEKAFKQEPEDPPRSVIGVWLDERPSCGRISIFGEDKKLFLESTYKDGSKRKLEIVEIPFKYGRKFEEKVRSDAGEYYFIDRQGNLQLHDRDGLITTAKKLSK
jgi:hypothetical protein